MELDFFDFFPKFQLVIIFVSAQIMCLFSKASIQVELAKLTYVLRFKCCNCQQDHGIKS